MGTGRVLEHASELGSLYLQRPSVRLVSILQKVKPKPPSSRGRQSPGARQLELQKVMKLELLRSTSILISLVNRMLSLEQSSMNRLE